MPGIAEEAEAVESARSSATVKAASKSPLDRSQLEHLPEIEAVRPSFLPLPIGC